MSRKRPNKHRNHCYPRCCGTPMIVVSGAKENALLQCFRCGKQIKGGN